MIIRPLLPLFSSNLRNTADRRVTLLTATVLAILQHRILAQRNHLNNVTFLQFITNLPRIVSPIAVKSANRVTRSTGKIVQRRLHRLRVVNVIARQQFRNDFMRHEGFVVLFPIDDFSRFAFAVDLFVLFGVGFFVIFIFSVFLF
jgi:hypothetical protein